MSTHKEEAKKSARPPKGKPAIGELEVKAVTKRIRAINSGPVHDWAGDFHIGVNQILGAQGVGKSHLVSLIARATGADLPIAVTDGENEAKLIIDDVPVLEYQRKKGKQPHVSLASVSTVALVVDPGIKDPASAEEARLKNLLKMVKAETTDEMIEFFLTPEPASEDDEPRVDAEAYDYVDVKYGIGRLKTLDPVAVADVLIKGKGGLIHTLKREYREKADRAHSKWEVAKPEKPAQLSELSLEEADEKYRVAVGDHRQAQGSFEQRREMVLLQAEIRQNLGERPDVDSAVSLHDEAIEGLDLARQRVVQLEKQLAVAKAQEESHKGVAARCAADMEAAKADAATWDRNKAKLDEPVTGATEDVVRAHAAKVEQARAALDLARSTAEYRTKLEVAEAARKERDEAQNREAEVSELADGVPARLGEQFNRLGIEGARVNEGVLEVKNEKGKFEPYWRRSAGQQWRWVLPIFLQSHPGGIVAHSKEAWNELEEENKLEVAQVHVDFGCIGVVEVTTKRGDPLRVEQFQG